MRGRPQYKERLRLHILDKRKLVRTGQGHLEPVPKEPHDPRKTLAMRLLESIHEAPIEELLLAGNLNQVAEALDIHFSTVSLWRRRLGLRNGDGE